MYKDGGANNVNGNDEDSEESGSGWISWFCDLEGHEFFIEVSVQQESMFIFFRLMMNT